MDRLFSGIACAIGWPMGWLIGLFARLSVRLRPEAHDHDKERLPRDWMACACGYARPGTMPACPACEVHP